ncbi:Superfamily II DNA/RNA helicases, SNF2 family [Thermoanaerobacter thermohydrosulfuricus]|uniref:Superfamily II DNA/RNA helicases, SNF2 family n=1 Tax=Thermoanaerobacter thermohydrosulfuricus TaxID=1516 RepID=A0A1G7LU69_THETY|nr:DEAD/DEAH box helicase [Thermoanaerobacter thermohydrosulfuricus]SDF52509.1 Superfamily II DNA/RNA helicases, SNF2 family [Thermoanaerobacter thermohydrosulfuricus]
MRLITFYTTGLKGQTGKVYTDFYLCSGDGSTPVVEMISFTGFPEHVEEFKRLIVENNTASIYTVWGRTKRIKFKGNYKFITENFGDYDHAIAVGERINNLETKYSIIMTSSLEVPAEKIFEVLKLKFTVPLSEKWTYTLFDKLIKENKIIRPQIYFSDKTPMKNLDFYELYITEEELAAIVTNGVKDGTFFIEGELNFNPHNINLTEYVKKHAHIFSRKLEETVEPIHNPLKHKAHPLVKNLKREAFEAQAHAITAIAKALKTKNNVILVGEMGSGKTFMSAAVPYIHSNGKPYRALVMCPAHLIEKWEREIQNTVPGAKVYILNSWKDVLKLKIGTPKEGYEYYVISKDRAKLHYSEKPAVIEQKHLKRIICPVCGSVIMTKEDKPADSGYFETHTLANHKCRVCKTKLWQADNQKFRRYAVSEYIKRHLKGYFDYFIADEVHELKGGDTAQGNTFGILSASARKTIVLTGTLLGGYASDIFYILYRLAPEQMKKAGFRYQDELKFTEKYGAIETITTEPDDESGQHNKNSKGWKKSTRKRKLPIISPQIFADFLIDKTVFIQLADLKQKLPEYKEYVDIIRPDPELKTAYNKLADELKSVINPYDGMRNLATYLMTLLRYPDHPFNNDPIDTWSRQIIPAELPDRHIYMKEQKLLNYVLSETQQGRRVFIYAHFTGEKDITKRLEMLLNKIGIKTAVLKAAIPPEKREEWLVQKVKEGYKCIISNFDLVKTGLDLYDFPTLIFYETGYSTYTLRQAAKRSWRIGQTKPVKVIFMVYKNTLQYDALTLMGNKLESAMNIEGQFSEDGLRALANSDNILTELAKSLIGDLKLETSLESIWEQIDSVPEPSVQEPIETIDQYSKPVSTVTAHRFKTVKIKDKKNKSEIQQLAIDFEALV